ncbi:MAG: hypothetical protein JHC98_10700 [Thermoleophilaceae bacterium]|nr:hypothetical protein [Thermoleophilaceae bacterium]
MSIVFADISVSADGFLAGPNPGHEHPLGMNGERLHEWIMDLYDWRASHGLEGGTRGEESDRMLASFESAGAFIMGRTMFETGEGPWGDDPPFHRPVFVLTHEQKPAVSKEGGTTFHFVNDGVESA